MLQGERASKCLGKYPSHSPNDGRASPCLISDSTHIPRHNKLDSMVCLDTNVDPHGLEYTGTIKLNDVSIWLCLEL